MRAAVAPGQEPRPGCSSASICEFYASIDAEYEDWLVEGKEVRGRLPHRSMWRGMVRLDRSPLDRPDVRNALWHGTSLVYSIARRGRESGCREFDFGSKWREWRGMEKFRRARNESGDDSRRESAAFAQSTRSIAARNVASKFRLSCLTRSWAVLLRSGGSARGRLLTRASGPPSRAGRR